MKNVLGEFSGGILEKQGIHVANQILQEVEDGELNITDDFFKHFLCCIFAEGNFEFLRVLARNWYPDSRIDVILEFIDLVEKTTLEGEKDLHEKTALKKAKIIGEILGGL